MRSSVISHAFAKSHSLATNFSKAYPKKICFLQVLIKFSLEYLLMDSRIALTFDQRIVICCISEKFKWNIFFDKNLDKIENIYTDKMMSTLDWWCFRWKVKVSIGSQTSTDFLVKHFFFFNQLRWQKVQR